MNKIIITVSGGLVQNVHTDLGNEIEVEIRDYDIDHDEYEDYIILNDRLTEEIQKMKCIY